MSFRLPLVLTALCAFASSSNAAVVYGLATDRELNESGALQTAFNGVTIRAGASGSAPAGGRNGLLVFQMPDFGAISNPFLSADFGLNLASLTGGAQTYNVDLYALGLQGSDVLAENTGVLSSARYYEGSVADPNATLIQLDFVTPATSGLGFKNTDDTGDLNLLNFLNAAYADGSGANQYMVFRINPDTNLNSSTIGYNFSSADAPNTATDPAITYTAVPEPASFLTLAGGLAALAFARRRRA